MNSSNPRENEFLDKLRETIETHITNPQFGVSMLAMEMGISRTTLHRRVNSATKITVSQFINQIRLKKAKELLRHTSETVSEVAYNVGYSNVSYFIKCFHEYYGYSPGEVGDREDNEKETNLFYQTKNKRLRTILASVIITLVLAVIAVVFVKAFFRNKNNLDKTIAVLLPQSNEDASNYYCIESIAQSVYLNLSLIKDFKKVVPWTSVIKYRNLEKGIPEIAKELNVNYIVESSGYIVDNKIQYSVTLINTSTHSTIWSDKYLEKFEDIIALENKIAKEVAEAINARITPEEVKRIENKPTENELAYAYYNRGKTRREDNLEAAVSLFEKALEYDNKFALAFAELAVTYFIMDTGEKEGMYQKQIEKYATLAMSYNNQHDICLVAQAYEYINKGETDFAVPFLERALEYNPNSIEALRHLRQIMRGTEKYIEYSLKAINLDMPSVEFVKTAGNCCDYQHMGQAFRHFGFFEEALMYYDKALEINVDDHDLYTGTLMQKWELLADIDGNYLNVKDLMLNFQQKDTSQTLGHGILGRIYYFTYDYEKSLEYYEKLIKKAAVENSENIYIGHIGRIAVVYSIMGKADQSEEYFQKYFEQANSRSNIRMKHFHLCGYHAFKGNLEMALEQMRKFAEFKECAFYQIRLLKIDPIFDNIRQQPEFDAYLNEIEDNFWENHNRIRQNLQEKRLL